MRSEEAAKIVLDAIAEHGGEMTHNHLVAELQSKGQGAAVGFLMGFTRSAVLRADVRVSANPGVPPVLWYLAGGES